MTALIKHRSQTREPQHRLFSPRVWAQVAWLTALIFLIDPHDAQSRSFFLQHPNAASNSVIIPSGVFVMGSRHGERDENPPHKVWLAAYQIDRFEVTQKEYDSCSGAGQCSPRTRFSGWEGDLLPAVGVSWHDARRYCAWRSNWRLPSEAQWERAASGGQVKRFPWGETFDCDYANVGNFSGDGPCAQHNPGKISAVGTRPRGVSAEGIHDLAGNAWEWVADWYGPYPKRRTGTIIPVRNPVGPPRGSTKVLRGAGCCSYFTAPTTTNRHHLKPTYRDRDIGFRCARSLRDARKASKE